VIQHDFPQFRREIARRCFIWSAALERDGPEMVGGRRVGRRPEVRNTAAVDDEAGFLGHRASGPTRSPPVADPRDRFPMARECERGRIESHDT